MAGMASRRFDELAVHDLPRHISESSILILPLGAIEAHGPHLPLNTDLIIAEHAATQAVAEFGDALDLWLLPALSYTKSNEHAWAPGTVWLSMTTMLAVLNDIGRSLATTKARKLVFLNGHGGNSALLQVALRELRLAYGFQTFLMQPFVVSGEGNEFGMPIHGGHDETSMLMAIRPDLVDVEKAVRAVPERLAANRHVRFGGSVSFGWLSDDFEPVPTGGELPVGLIGDGTGANAELGQQLWSRILATMGEALTEISAWDSRAFGPS
jgi:creatinine amidohydrolase